MVTCCPIKNRFELNTALCQCFDKLNMTESCQSELIEDGFQNGSSSLIAQHLSILINCKKNKCLSKKVRQEDGNDEFIWITEKRRCREASYFTILLKEESRPGFAAASLQTLSSGSAHPWKKAFLLLKPYSKWNIRDAGEAAVSETMYNNAAFSLVPLVIIKSFKK